MMSCHLILSPLIDELCKHETNSSLVHVCAKSLCHVTQIANCHCSEHIKRQQPIQLELKTLSYKGLIPTHRMHTMFIVFVYGKEFRRQPVSWTLKEYLIELYFWPMYALFSLLDPVVFRASTGEQSGRRAPHRLAGCLGGGHCGRCSPISL